MTTGYFIRKDDKTSCGGTVLEGQATISRMGGHQAREGDRVSCGKNKKTYTIAGGIPTMISDGRAFAGTLHSVSGCPCRATLIHSLTTHAYGIDPDAPPRATRNSAQPAASAAPQNAQASGSAHAAATSNRSASSFVPQPEVVCQNIWRMYQENAESIVAPGGVLIADPRARNRAINAAYARLWRHDQRFQWAGLAAFASKQVGCGLLHAAQSIEKIQASHDAGQQLAHSGRKGFWGLFSRSAGERKAAVEDFKNKQREEEQARRDNPLPNIDIRREGEPLTLTQQTFQHVYEMLALGNTTLFLDVYPLHAFYGDRGMWALEACLSARKGIFGDARHPVLWPVAPEKLKFGVDQQEILHAFRAIEAGKIADSVEWLAKHEQKNILQPTMYSDALLVALLRANHLSYVTDFPSGAAQAIELTLASQCQPVDDGRTIGFSKEHFADLSDLDQRMAFVLRAAGQFHELLSSTSRHSIERAIEDIAAGRGVQ